MSLYTVNIENTEDEALFLEFVKAHHLEINTIENTQTKDDWKNNHYVL